MTLQNNHNPIFLIVTHRCGTTWLGSLFDSLDEIAYWCLRISWVWNKIRGQKLTFYTFYIP